MSDEDAFIRSIGECADDSAPRLVFADWLEERGDPRGEYLRLAVQIHDALSVSQSDRMTYFAQRRRSGRLAQRILAIDPAPDVEWTEAVLPSAVEVRRLQDLADAANDKARAEVFRIAIRSGCVDAREVIAWADGVILDSDVATADIIPVSLSSPWDGAEVEWALRGVDGEVSDETLVRAALQFLAFVARDYPERRRAVARALYELWSEGLTPDEDSARSMGWLEHAFSLAEEGLYTMDTLDEVEAELMQFLARWLPPVDA
jgi:uncharacterized protein (TIGR02996 family)